MSVSHIAPPPRRTTLKADETRELILGAAELRFAATGFYPCRLEDIADDVGITRTAVIYHFQDKETLIESYPISIDWPSDATAAAWRPVDECRLALRAGCVLKYNAMLNQCLRV